VCSPRILPCSALLTRYSRESFDEYTRRQYLSKAPEKNPFGTDETPASFADFDVFTKIRVLQQMTQLIMMNPERLRERTEEQKDVDQTNWVCPQREAECLRCHSANDFQRIEPYGWDSDDRTYYVLDDNRIYRLTDVPREPPKPKKNSKKGKAAQRASKRRRVSEPTGSDAEELGHESLTVATKEEDDGFGGRKWECVAVSLGEVQAFVSTFERTKDANEKVLRNQIQQHLIPILEKQEESRNRKQLQREKELLNLEKMAHAKRSNRIAKKLEQQKIEEQVKEEERKREQEEVMKRKEESRRTKFERERESRLMSREQRLKEREIRRLQHQEELAQLSEDSRSTGPGPGRMSERHRQAEIEKNKKALKELEEEEDDWIFDCLCGVYGQVDDGTHSVACERCNVWQHSKCLGIDEKEADQDDFHFICAPCRQHEAEKDQRPRIIKLRVNRPGSSSSSHPDEQIEDDSLAPQSQSQLVVEIESRTSAKPPLADGDGTHERASDDLENGQSEKAGRDYSANDARQQNGSFSTGVLPLDTSFKSSPSRPGTNPFSSTHPHLSPPAQSPDKSRAYHTLFDQAIPALDISRDRQAPSGEQPSIAAGLPRNPSSPTESGNYSSPSKRSQRHSSPLPTKTTSPSVFPAKTSTAVPATGDLTGTPSASTDLPQFTPYQTEGGGRPSPLPPSRGGLSPTKHSPTLQRHSLHQVNGISNGGGPPVIGASPSTPVYPPTAALSPSPRPQVLTPPVKSTDPGRVSSQD